MAADAADNALAALAAALAASEPADTAAVQREYGAVQDVLLQPLLTEAERLVRSGGALSTLVPVCRFWIACWLHDLAVPRHHRNSNYFKVLIFFETCSQEELDLYPPPPSPAPAPAPASALFIGPTFVADDHGQF